MAVVMPGAVVTISEGQRVGTLQVIVNGGPRPTEVVMVVCGILVANEVAVLISLLWESPPGEERHDWGWPAGAHGIQNQGKLYRGNGNLPLG